MSLRLEAWTPPGVADVHKKIETLDVVEASGKIVLRGRGNARIVVADDFEDMALLTYSVPGDPSQDVASLIRVYDDDVWLQDWLLEPAPAPLDEDGLVELGGDDVISVFDWAYVEAFDWNAADNFTTVDPDWSYGDGRNLLRDGDFELETFPNGGFEDGNAGHWGTDGGSIVAVHDAVQARSGEWYGLFNPSGQGSRVVRSITGLEIGDQYVVTGFLDDLGGAGDRWRAGISGATDAAHTNAYFDEDEEIWWAEVNNAAEGTGASTGGYDEFELAFEAGESVVQLIIEYADTNDHNAALDDWTVVGDSITVGAWAVGQAPATITTAEVSSEQAHSGSTSLKIQGEQPAWVDGFGRISYVAVNAHQKVGLTPGKLYTARFWVYHTGAGDEYFVVRMSRTNPAGPLAPMVNGGFAPAPGSYDMAARYELVPPNTWTVVEVSSISDTTEIRFSAAWAGAYRPTNDLGVLNSPVFYLDDMAVFEGLPESTIGRIFLDQRDHMDLRGALPFITYDFTDEEDSAGNAWDTRLQQRLRHGMRQSTLIGIAEGLGYDVRLVPDDFDALTYTLQIFNPGTTDAGSMGITPAGGSPSILVGQGTASGTATPRHAAWNAVQVLGSGGRTSRAVSAASETAIGRRERFLFDETTDPPVRAAELLSDGLNQGFVEGVAVAAGGDWPLPRHDYDVGWYLDWDLADGNGKQTHRVGAFSYQEQEESGLTFTVFPDRETFSGQGAVNEAVRRLLMKEEFPVDVGTPTALAGGEGGGMKHILVVSTSEPAIVQAGADFTVSADASDGDLQAVFDFVAGQSPDGPWSIWMAGVFTIDTDLVAPEGAWIRGLGYTADNPCA